MERVRVKNPSWLIPWIYGLIIVIVIAVGLVAAMVSGSVDTTWSATTQVISHHLFRTELDEPVPASLGTIVWNLRAPRGILAAIAGAGLVVSGVTMRTLIYNPLTDPYLLGISVGAGASATAAIIFGAFPGSPIAPLTFGVLLGVVAATLAVDAFTTAGGGLTPLRPVLSGVVLSAVFSALSSFMVFAGSGPRAAQFTMLWMLGSVAGATWVKTLLPFIALIAALLLFLIEARRLDASTTGENTAVVIGINVIRLRVQVFVFQAAPVDMLVAVSGGIGLVGLVILHLAHILAGATHRAVLPVVALMGGLLLTWMDITACVVGESQEMPLGVVTGLIGTSLFLYFMSRSHYNYGGAE